MTNHSKTFEYHGEGLSYTVTVYEKGGKFEASITVTEGAMDVNAIYFGDDDFSGKSESLKGPLNMNGSHHDKDLQWDVAIRLSDPGLGSKGADKDTYLSEGDTLEVDLDIESLDEIDFFGIRATSTTTEEGSIKAVLDHPEKPEEPEEDPTFDKVFFGEEFAENGGPLGGAFILADEPVQNEFNIPFLPEGTEPTFDNYVTHYVEVLGGDVTALEGVSFYSNDDEGNLEEVYRIEAPEEGFESQDDLLEIFDQAVEDGAFEGVAEEDGALELMAALSLPSDNESTMPEDDQTMDLTDLEDVV